MSFASKEESVVLALWRPSVLPRSLSDVINKLSFKNVAHIVHYVRLTLYHSRGFVPVCCVRCWVTTGYLHYSLAFQFACSRVVAAGNDCAIFHCQSLTLSKGSIIPSAFDRLNCFILWSVGQKPFAMLFILTHKTMITVTICPCDQELAPHFLVLKVSIVLSFAIIRNLVILIGAFEPVSSIESSSEFAARLVRNCTLYLLSFFEFSFKYSSLICEGELSQSVAFFFLINLA